MCIIFLMRMQSDGRVINVKKYHITKKAVQ